VDHNFWLLEQKSLFPAQPPLVFTSLDSDLLLSSADSFLRHTPPPPSPARAPALPSPPVSRWRRWLCGNRRRRVSTRSAPSWRRTSPPTPTRPASGSSSSTIASSPTSTTTSSSSSPAERCVSHCLLPPSSSSAKARVLGCYYCLCAVLVPMLTVSSSCSAMPIDSIASIDLGTCCDAILISVSNKLIAGKVNPPERWVQCVC
jgi:hypothetical protein